MIRLLCHRLRPPEFPEPVERDFALEGLRGSCALLVFVAHLLLPLRVLDPAWTPSERFGWFNLGYPAVLMFFVLSGYVIGMVTSRPASPAAVRHYLWHRAARLLPLNTLAVLLCWLLLVHPGTRTVLGNLAFLQNYDPYPGLGDVPVLANNPNLWSLNYEAVYYLGFIALWIWAPPAAAVLGGLALVVCAHAFGLPVSRVFARYACGAFFWLAGLMVAWTSARPLASPRSSNWPAAALAAYAIWIFAPPARLVHSLAVVRLALASPDPCVAAPARFPSGERLAVAGHHGPRPHPAAVSRLVLSGRGDRRPRRSGAGGGLAGSGHGCLDCVARGRRAGPP